MSNFYISNYVLAGFGELKKDSGLIPEKIFGKKYIDFMEKLLSYCDKQFPDDRREIFSRVDPLFYAHARSYWKADYPMADSSVKRIQDLLNERWKKAANYSLYDQAVLINTTLRYFDKGSAEYQKAIQQLNSIEQLAIKDDGQGIRWKAMADEEDMSNSSEETLALLIEAFTDAGIHPELSSGIIKWLLTAKNEDHWSSTKATAAVIEILLQQKETATGITQTINGSINNKRVSITDDLLSGTGFSFINESRAMPVELKKESNASASGNVTWYYFSTPDNLSKANKEITLKKELSRYNEITLKWEPVNETSLKIADKIKVVLTIETSRPLRYVYIDDKRAATFEPRENHSGYAYAEGFSYYQSVRDVGLQFFSEFIPSGRSTISYELIVAHEGNFTNGPASLQCMYKPELSACSNSITVKTIK